MKTYLEFIKESLSTKPSLKFPTEKAVHIEYIISLFYDYKNDDIIEPKIKEELSKYNFKTGKYRDNKFDIRDFYKFVAEKLYDKVVFPKKPSYDKNHEYYKLVTDRESVVLLPKHYNSRLDFANSMDKKQQFFQKMADFHKQMKTTFNEKEYEDNVNFGLTSFEFVNCILNFIYEKFKDYYINDELRVWFPTNNDGDYWKGYDYPHKYTWFGEIPKGIYFLSDIEKFIMNKYGLEDNEIYDFIIHNQYIEGRYWERIWGFNIIDGKIPRKLKTKYGGMNSTKSLNSILDIIEIEFKNDIIKIDNESYLPVYIDYYKKISIL